MVDTSTEAVTELLDGVTPGPWTGDPRFSTIVAGEKCIAEVNTSDADARFIAAARDLVPALLAERDALRRENENLRQTERNVQDVREHEYKRAEAALAEVERLKAERDALWDEVDRINAHPVTVHDAAKVPEVRALIDAIDYIVDGMGIEYPDYQLDPDDDYLDAANAEWVKDTLSRLAAALRAITEARS